MRPVKMSSEDRHRAVAFCSVLVALDVIGMEEFIRVVIVIDSAEIEEEDVSQGFLVKLAEFYRS